MSKGNFLVVLFAALTLAGSVCACAADAGDGDAAADSEEEVRATASKPRADERVPGYGVHFARFPTAVEDGNLAGGEVPYARVNFYFVPTTDYSTPASVSGTDADILAAAGHGVTILPTIFTGRIPSTALPALAEYTQRLAERYGPGGALWGGKSPKVAIRAWEIGNEPNLSRVGFNQGTPDDYRGILRAARKGLRKGDPRARIVFAGLSELNAPEAFLRKVVDGAGGRCLFDAVGFHPYDPTPEGATKKVESMLSAMRDLGLVGGNEADDVQLWITEVGWGLGSASDKGPVATSPEQQAKFISDFAASAEAHRHAWRLGPTVWYSYYDAGGEQGWAATSGIYGRPAWATVRKAASRERTVLLPPVRCPGT